VLRVHPRDAKNELDISPQRDFVLFRLRKCHNKSLG
jgi:hypothetical protein